ncbi:MAG: gliding motility-associated C-terminal domain-containing protein [Bacteroidales bacterium]|nr:gliding motility-associated C-terminal domain-containing protein [Bacteroidales bacterium]
MQKLINISIILIITIFQSTAQDIERYVPKIDSVSVNKYNDNVIISWSFTSDSIYQFDSVVIASYKDYGTGPRYFRIDSVPHEKFIYYDNNPDYNIQPESYGIAAKYGGNLSLWSLPHNTIYVSCKFDSCSSTNLITWNKYINWDESVNEYRIFRNNEFLLATSDTFYLDSNLNPDTEYCYFIRCISDSGKSSTSNNYCLVTNMPIPPQFLFTDYASVSANNELTLSFSVDTNADILKYNLLRSDIRNGTYDTIYTFESNNTDSNLFYKDNINTNNIFYYKINAYNTCSVKVATSDTINNIVLKASNNNLTNTLQWNKTMPEANENHLIYRSFENQNFINIITIDENTDYADDISLFLNNPQIEGKFYYYIEAKNKNTFQISRSNIAITTQKPVLDIPNIFTPNDDGKNDFFEPNISFASSKDFSMIIYNRWGEKIFESKTPGETWDGTKNGKLVQEGSYIYFIKFRTSENNYYETTGKITVYFP